MTKKFIGGVDFAELRKSRPKVYDTIPINLAVAHTNEEIFIAGTYLYALEATDIVANIDIRLNEIIYNDINLTKGRGLRAPFYRVFYSNTAQVGKSITLAFGVESETFEVIDIGRALEITGDVNVYLKGAGGTPNSGVVTVSTFGKLLVMANFNRRQVQLRNIGPTGAIIYLGATSSVTTATGFPIYPMIDSPELSKITLVIQQTIWGICALTTGTIRYYEENN